MKWARVRLPSRRKVWCVCVVWRCGPRTGARRAGELEGKAPEGEGESGSIAAARLERERLAREDNEEDIDLAVKRMRKKKEKEVSGRHCCLRGEAG